MKRLKNIASLPARPFRALAALVAGLSDAERSLYAGLIGISAGLCLALPPVSLIGPGAALVAPGIVLTAIPLGFTRRAR